MITFVRRHHDFVKVAGLINSENKLDILSSISREIMLCGKLTVEDHHAGHFPFSFGCNTRFLRIYLLDSTPVEIVYSTIV